MKMNFSKTRRVFIMLGLVMMLAVVLAACVNTEDVPEVQAEFESREDISIGGESEIRDLEPEEGQSNAPVVTNVVNISPLTVAVSGTCDEGSTIYIKCMGEVTEVASRDGYFIAEVDLVNDGGNLLAVTAKTGDLAESKAWEEAVYKDATADTRLDGMSVSVGTDSRLYFDYMKANYEGAEGTLYTVTELNKIRDQINKDVANVIKFAGQEDAEILYVLLPDSAYLTPDVFPEGTEKSETGTVYDQMLGMLEETRASYIDMREYLQSIQNDPKVIENGGLYRVTDSSLTDYASYLVYSRIMQEISVKFPNAAARPETDFEWNKIENVAGGNMVTYRELDGSIITEDILKFNPKFDMNLGEDSKDTDKLSSIVKYLDADDNDYNFATTVDAEDGVKNIAERFNIDTGRADAGLPTAIILRDYNSLSFIDILAERFEKSLVLKNGEFYLNTTDANKSTFAGVAADGDTAPDYVIYILSEQSMRNAFSNLLSN